MKIILVRPQPSPLTIGLQHLMIVEPLELEVLAALASPEDELLIVDMILEKQPLEYFLRDFRPELFCTTGYITHLPVMMDYCRKAKAALPNVKTVVGGVHVEKFPEDIDSPDVDFRVVRNATHAFPQLLDHLKYGAPFPAGVLRPGEAHRPQLLPPYDFYFPLPRRELTARYRHKYFYVFHDKVALMKTAFGCPYQCNFCFCRKITDDHYFARPLEDVLEELFSIREKEVYIVDDDFLLSPKRVAAFINMLKAHNIRKRYLVYGRADFIIRYPELIREFRAVGLRTVIVGLESFDDEELEHYNKHSSRDINERAMKVLNRYGVDCYAAVITAPNWDAGHFQRAGDKMLELGIKFVNLQPLTPLKGTGIEVPDEHLAIRHDDYARWDLAHVAIRPEKMSLREYYAQILHLYERIVFNPANMLSLAVRHPLRMQWKLAKGIRRVRQQYLKRIEEASSYAEDITHTSHTV